MRFFNLLGNKFFSQAFSCCSGRASGTPLRTKVLSRHDYEVIAENVPGWAIRSLWRFRPDLRAARFNLKISDMPVRYGARTYGETNIQRWSHAGCCCTWSPLRCAHQVQVTAETDPTYLEFRSWTPCIRARLEPCHRQRALGGFSPVCRARAKAHQLRHVPARLKPCLIQDLLFLGLPLWNTTSPKPTSESSLVKSFRSYGRCGASSSPHRV